MKDVQKAAATEAKKLQTLANGGSVKLSAKKAPIKKTITKKK